MTLEAPLPEFVAFDAPVEVDNAYGGTRTGWDEKVKCRARFRYLRAGEAVTQARLAGQVTVVATIRANRDSRAIRPDWRMRDALSGDVYNVRSIIPTDDRLYLEVTCQGGVAV